MSKDEFILKINKSKVDFSNIKGGIKKEDIKDEKMKSIFDAIDTDDEKGVLSDEEVKTFFGLVKEQAQKHNSKNLGNKEYKKLLKELEKNGIKFENVTKETFLKFLYSLKEASNKVVEEATEDPVVEAEDKTDIPEEEKEEVEKEDNTATENKSTKVIVQLAETPEKLAQKFGCTVEEIKELNKDKLMKNGKWFRAGDEIVIPREIAPEALEGRKNSEEVNNEYREWRARRAATRNAGADRGAGAADGGGDAGAASGRQQKPHGKFTTDQIKVHVPYTYYSESKIKRFMKDGADIAEGKKGIEALTPGNVAYSVSKYSTKDMETIFKNLVSRMRQLEIFNEGKEYGFYGSFSKLPIAKQGAIIAEYAKRIKKVDKELLNAKKEAQKQADTFFEANKLLVDVANGAVTVEKKVYNGDKKVKTATLEDGRWIRVDYDDSGEICAINISHDTIPDEDDNDYADVVYFYYYAKVSTEHDGKWQNTITSGFNFTELKKVAEAIFGKWEE